MLVHAHGVFPSLYNTRVCIPAVTPPPFRDAGSGIVSHKIHRTSHSNPPKLKSVSRTVHGVSHTRVRPRLTVPEPALVLRDDGNDGVGGGQSMSYQECLRGHKSYPKKKPYSPHQNDVISTEIISEIIRNNMSSQLQQLIPPGLILSQTF